MSEDPTTDERHLPGLVGQPVSARRDPDRRLTRRAVLRLGGGALAGGAVGSVLGWTALGRDAGRTAVGRPAAPPRALQPAAVTHNFRLVATDGFMSYPGRRTPPGNTTGDFGDPGDGVYSFGFRAAEEADLGGADPFTAPIGDLVPLYKGRVHNPAPTLAVESDADVFITMSNLGFEGRPDLDDAHTIHWHGFRQQVVIFDGVPEASISVPPLRDFPYYFPTRGVGFEGTYIYHCHFEDTEHVQMGMDGVIFIRPPDTGVKRVRRPLHGVRPGVRPPAQRDRPAASRQPDRRPGVHLVRVRRAVLRGQRAVLPRHDLGERRHRRAGHHARRLPAPAPAGVVAAPGQRRRQGTRPARQPRLLPALDAVGGHRHDRGGPRRHVPRAPRTRPTRSTSDRARPATPSSPHPTTRAGSGPMSTSSRIATSTAW